jgi:peptidoglycan/xylan/chitin deacetylase (PgdA/CDA1 family)
MSYALTFDDGPGPSTGALLDVLKEFNVKATFFVLGRNIFDTPWAGARRPDIGCGLVIRAFCEGHSIGNHTWFHSPEHAVSRREFIAEIRRMDARLQMLRRLADIDDELGFPLNRNVGQLPAHLIPVRLPYGENGNDERAKALHATGWARLYEHGRPNVGWHASFADWLPSADPQEIATAMLRVAGEWNPAVLLLHDSGEDAHVGFDRSATVEAVRIFLTEAAKRNLSSAPLPL